jgi:hypothetical protein
MPAEKRPVRSDWKSALSRIVSDQQDFEGSSQSNSSSLRANCPQEFHTVRSKGVE